MGPAVITHGHMEGKVQGGASGPKGNRDRHLEVGLVNFFPDELFQLKFMRKIGHGSSSNNTWAHGGPSTGGGSWSQGESGSALRSGVGELFPGRTFSVEIPAKNRVWVQQ